ncbi:MAG TPA: cytochrome P450 [Thermoleophilaceae bacterium]|nr:cytochrome P450 [Thermoleophilaceae bacterium]
MTELPPGPRLPRPAQTVAWITRTGPFLERCRARYGDVFTVKIAQEGTWVMLADPAHVREVFRGDPKVFHAGEANAILRPVLGHNSVLLLDEEAHMSQRKLLLPPFHGERMQRYGDVMREIAEREIERWPSGQPLKLWPRMQAVTLEVIMRAVFGMDEGAALDRLRATLRDTLDWATRPAQMASLALLGPHRVERLPWFRDRFKDVDALLYEEIRARRADPRLEEREDIMSMLLQARHEDGSPMTDEELRDELMTLLVAGHETTATSLAWAIERLVRHPDKLERLREEADSGGDEYADAVAKETLRLRPVIPIVVRRLTEPVEIGGYTLPAGVKVAPCIYLMHRHASAYRPDPTAFRPERFLEQPAGTYTWIPFGGGVRRCIGATFAVFEMKVVLSAIARTVDLRPLEEPPERVVRRAITLTPNRGAEVVSARRLGAAPEPRREAAAAA